MKPIVRFRIVMLLSAFVATLGCTRQYYRQDADWQVACIVQEKSTDPRYALPPNFSIEQDPRSRYYDPYDPDRPPMPEDDPEAHRYMHCVHGMKGWPCWHCDGDRLELENPTWREQLYQYAPFNENGQLILSLDTALQLAYIHSPELQEQLETVYLSALDVSTERFRLETQFFGGNDTTFDHLGRLRPGGERNTLATDTDFSLTRRFSTAAELLVGFANSFVWQFAGPNTNATSSLINFSLIQPLLRGAGRDIALEQLTIVERGLLANLRAMQRFREGFYTEIAIGQSGVAGPQRRGGFFGGTGLTGFTGQGAGGLGGVGAATGFGRGGFGAGGGAAGGAGAGFVAGGAGQVGGFIGLLQSLQEIRNTQVSLNSQLRTVSLLEANLEAGVIDLTQVDQFRQNIESERAVLLQSEIGLQNALETYIVGSLGLPPDLPVTLDDDLIQQFQFIDEQTTALQTALGDLQLQVGAFSDQPEESEVRAVLEASEVLTQQLDEIEAMIDEDLQNVNAQADQRRRVAADDADRDAFDTALRNLGNSMAELKSRFAEIENQRQALESRLTQANSRQIADELVIWIRDLLTMAQEAALIQARARLESVVIEPIELSATDAFNIAWTTRLDIMNNRANLVDSWRLIQFNADALQSNLDVFFTGDMGTVGNNPVKFRGANGSLAAGIRFDAPFTRLLERNNFRQSLIDYQRDRRQFIQFRDFTLLSLRQSLRNLEQLKVNLEIQRRAVVIAIRRVDLTRETLNEPTPPPEPGQPANQLGPTAALNLLTALSDLRSAQNNFISVWLNYYAGRMSLVRDLGLMQLDENGAWIDIPLSEIVPPAEVQDDLPPDVPTQWVEFAFSEQFEDGRPEGSTTSAASAQGGTTDKRPFPVVRSAWK